MDTGSGKALPPVYLKPEQIPDTAFVRCPKVGFDHVQVREACCGCEHRVAYVDDPSVRQGQEPLYGTGCAFPIARWWKHIAIRTPEKK